MVGFNKSMDFSLINRLAAKKLDEFHGLKDSMVFPNPLKTGFLKYLTT